MSEEEKIIDPVPLEPGFPPNAWRFDTDVTDQFEQMLERSIPQYDVMRRACFDVGAAFVVPGPDIVDLGCARGQAIAPFVFEFGSLNRYSLCEVSEPMLAATRERFSGWLDPDMTPRMMRAESVDLRESYPKLITGAACLTLCVLTLQFTPIEYRKRIVQNIFDTTMPGGALILVEKVIGDTQRLDDLMTRLYLARKAERGYTTEEIDRKRHALEGVLVPLTAQWNVQQLQSVGFSQIDCFWRWMNFAAWVAVKG